MILFVGLVIDLSLAIIKYIIIALYLRIVSLKFSLSILQSYFTKFSFNFIKNCFILINLKLYLRNCYYFETRCKLHLTNINITIINNAATATTILTTTATPYISHQ